MAVAAASALPAMLQAGVLSASLGGGDSRCPSRRYRKYELIGQGAQKKVYRAFDEERGIEVAWNEVAVAELARFREKDQQRVFAEIRVLKQLKHKNIMTLHDYWFDERRLMLVFITEIFPDGTLRQYRRRHKHADLPAIKHWCWQVLQGLVYLHGHNPPIIHRDLKCDNIFVCGSSGIVKIGDLGLVTLCKDFSAPQSVLGTPEFMAPELYEEKYDEKVDVYAFGMCLLELATMEYPYEECKNAAQIYKKVTQGIPPASVEKLASAELRDFVMLCLCHDPHHRPEARQLLKHSFFEAIRAAPTHLAGGCGTPPKLTVVSSMSVSPSNAPPPRPLTLTSAASATTAALMAAAAAGAAEDLSPTALSRATSSGSGGGAAMAAEPGSGGSGVAPGAGLALGSIAAAAGGGGAAVVQTNSLLSVRSTSIELPQLQPLGAIAAAALSPQPLSPIAAAANGMHAFGTGGGAAAAMVAAAAAMPVPAPSMGMGSIAAAASAPSVQLSVSPFGTGALGSIASSLSPTARDGMANSVFTATAAAADGSVSSSPGLSPAAGAAARGGGNPALPRQSSGGDFGGAAGSSGPTSPAASGLTAALQLSPGPSPGCGGAMAGGGSTLSPAPRPPALEVSSVAAAGDADAYGRCGYGMGVSGGSGSCGARLAESRSQQAGGQYAGVSASAAAIAAAAVSAAAAAVGASSGPPLTSPLGLPAIHEDHELQEELMFDQDDYGRRGVHYGGQVDSDEDGDDGNDVGSGADSPAGAVAAQMMGGGGRSQPVSLQVRSSGQAAISNMALSFAMSFTNQRGVRKKVGFQYDLLHDTASAIAVEMVENLSLNTAEAEAIAAMIQHEVSRFNSQQQQQEQQQPQQ